MTFKKDTVKVNSALEWAVKSQKGLDLTGPFFLELRGQMGTGGQRHAPTALPRGKRAGTYFRKGWVDRRTGLDG